MEERDRGIVTTISAGQPDFPTQHSGTPLMTAPKRHSSTGVRRGRQPKSRHRQKDGKKPLLMFCCLLCGVVLAIAHHFYYSSLNRKVTTSSNHQQWAIRFGTAFAFLAISFFRAAVTVAYVQLLWRVLRKKALRIVDIDSLFSIVSDMTAFLTTGIYTSAIVALPLAMVIW
jgi:hypothetical protein